MTVSSCLETSDSCRDRQATLFHHHLQIIELGTLKVHFRTSSPSSGELSQGYSSLTESFATNGNQMCSYVLQRDGALGSIRNHICIPSGRVRLCGRNASTFLCSPIFLVLPLSPLPKLLPSFPHPSSQNRLFRLARGLLKATLAPLLLQHWQGFVVLEV